MQDIEVDSLTYHFGDDCIIVKYDELPFYKKHLQNFNGKSLKAVDIVALIPENGSFTLYMIESKDYRNNRREKPMAPDEEYYLKVMDTFTGLVPCSLYDGNNSEERKLHEILQRAQKIKLICQFEQRQKPSKLFPRPFDLADLQTKARKKLKSIDPHLRFVDKTMSCSVPWTVD